MTDQEQQPNDENLEKEAREISPDKAMRKLKELALESGSFEGFKTRLSDRRWWYLGDPMPEPFRSWTWATFEQFYNEVKMGKR